MLRVPRAPIYRHRSSAIALDHYRRIIRSVDHQLRIRRGRGCDADVACASLKCKLGVVEFDTPVKLHVRRQY